MKTITASAMKKAIRQGICGGFNPRTDVLSAELLAWYFPRSQSAAAAIVGSSVIDFSGNGNDGALVQSNCLSFNGTTQYVSVPALVGTETVASKQGTATASIVAGQINVTAGTLCNLVLSNGSHYTFSEGSGSTIYDVSGNGNHGTAINSPTWATQDVFHYDLLNGFSEGVNELKYSEELDNATTWNDVELTVTQDSTTSPNGSLTADLLTESVNASSHYIEQGVTYASGQYTYSIYGKQASGTRYLQLRSGGGGGNSYANYDLNNGIVVVGGTGGSEFVSANIQSVGSGWYRCNMVSNHAILPSSFQIIISNGTGVAPSYTGDGTSGVYIWGTQLESGTSATPYQPTTGSSNVGAKVPSDINEYVPNGGTDAPSNPAVNGHNGAETKLNINPVGAPSLINAGIPQNTLWTYGDDPTAKPYTVYRRAVGGLESDFAIFSGALSAQDDAEMDDYL